MPDYDSLDFEPEPDKTQTGGVKHNGGRGLESEVLAFPQQPRRPEARESAEPMANELLNQNSEPQAAAAIAEGYELDITFGIPIEERPIWVDLYESIRDVFFPPKLPPLELTSTPIPVPDRMAVKPNPWAIGIATAVNLLILVAVIYLGARVIIEKMKPALITTDIDVGEFKAPNAATKAGGGGGGGDHSVVDPSKGKLPKIEKDPITPPQVQTVDKPKLAMLAAIDVQKQITLPDNPMLPNIGVKSSVNVKLDSNGQGGGGGMGTGNSGGLGSGNGIGYGPGSGANTGGGPFHVGGNISSPVALFQPEAEFSDEARRAKYQGEVTILLIVDAQGNPQNPRVVRPLGMGLDEKAIEAVMKYKFKPAMKDGKTPVPVLLQIVVNFRLY